MLSGKQGVIAIGALSLVFIIFVSGIILGQRRQQAGDADLLSPFIEQKSAPRQKKLLAYTIPNLITREYSTSPLVIESEIKEEASFSTFVFSYQTGGKKITGQLNIPRLAFGSNNPTPVIILVRGYVPPENYQTGMGTQNAAAAFARQGFITVAPDFLGYGGSDAELSDSWEARFIKPVQLIELIKSLEKGKTNWQLAKRAGEEPPITSFQDFNPTATKIGIWAHSNGGQITLTALEVLNRSYPTTLWAPVTAPFPYSILYFSDENQDEGKAMRKWIAMFEQDYDVFEFSLRSYLDRLVGPLQLHHGTADDAALKVWSDEFAAKIESINNQRQVQLTQSAVFESTSSAALAPIALEYFVYQNADHNLQPAWNTVVQRDVQFFTKYLKGISP